MTGHSAGHGQFADALLGWHREHRRSLPWRETRDPYRVLISEVMLQQTQVARVLGPYERFLARFPDVAALAAASPADVLVQWRGLGYNRRALALHRCAVAVVERHGGTFPRDLSALRALPGVGEYTARALLAFAFGEPAAPVDVNVARVLARAVAAAPLARAEAQRLADDLAAGRDPAGWTAALMDLGALLCTARTPRCADCPVAARCAWRRRGGSDPALANANRSRPQSTFVGSDRFHRGRLLDALRRAPVPATEIARAAGLSDRARAEAIGAALVADGLAEWQQGELRLPSTAAAGRLV